MKLPLTFFQKYKDILFLLFLSLTPLLWYGTDANMLLVSHDVGFPLNPLEFFKNRFFAWNSAPDFGFNQLGWIGTSFYHTIEAGLTLFTGSVSIGQRIYVILWFFLPMVSIYWLIKKIPGFMDKKYMGLLAAVLFAFNHFQIQGWVVFWRARFATYIALPLILGLLIDYMEGKRSILRTSVLVGLIILVFNGGGSPPIFGAPIILVLTVLFFYLLINLKNNFWLILKRSISFVISCCAVILFTSAFWIIPYLYFIYKTYFGVIETIGGSTGVAAWADEVSMNASIINLLRLEGISGWHADSTYEYIRIFLTHPIFIFISFLFPILAFSSFLFIKKVQEKKYLFLFSLLAIVGLVFTAGSHEPFRQFYIFLLKNIPGYAIFRTPFFKFGNLLWFALIVLIAFSLSSIIEKITTFLVRKSLPVVKANNLLVGGIILIILAYNFPLFNAKLFEWSPSLSTMEKIPQYVFDFGKWMDKQDGFSARTLLLPELTREWRADAYKWGYWSLNTAVYTLTGKNFLSNEQIISGTEYPLTVGLYDALKNNDAFWPDLAYFFGVNSFLLRNDVYYDLKWTPTTPPSVYKKILAKNKEIEKIKSFGEWDFYQFKNKSFNKIFISKNDIYYDFQDNDYINILRLLYADNTEGLKNLTLIPVDKKDIPREGESRDGIIIVLQPYSYQLPVKISEFAMPKLRFLPGSPFYFLTEGKEQEARQKAKSKEELIDIYLGLSLKRLAELDKLLKLQATQEEINSILERYSVILSEIHRIFSVLNKNKLADEIISRSKFFLSEERNFLAGLINVQKNELIKKTLNNTYKAAGDVLRSIKTEDEASIPLEDWEQAFYDPNVVLLTRQYKWTIPQAGVYSVYLNSDSLLANSSEVKIDVDGRTVNSKQITDNREQETPLRPAEQDSAGQANTAEGWEKIGEVDLEKGEHGLEITADGIPVYSFKRGDIIFYKTDNSEQTTVNSRQKISYIRLNPTRYKVEVGSFDKPITLVFNERFDKDWKLYKIKNQISKIKDKNENILVRIRNILDENMFNTLWLKPLPEDSHIKVNGYANSWTIDKSEILNPKSETSTFIIEYWPQRLLWLGYSVSIASVLGAIAYLVITHKRRKVIK